MKITTPAKIILSGEHSVVYGAPALGAPLALFLHSYWQIRAEDEGILLNLQGKPARLMANWQDVDEACGVYQERYQKFEQGQKEIAAVLRDPHDLVLLTLGLFRRRFDVHLPGLILNINTEIPLSSGLGSSSSLIYNLLTGLLRLTGQEMALPDLLEFARQIENFQHGISSGIDLALVAARHPVVFRKGQGIIGTLAPISFDLVLVNSGRPTVSTGQCVARVREIFGPGHSIWDAFSTCTTAIEGALRGRHFQNLVLGVMENQKLLEKIGVVPEKVHAFVAECRMHGIAVKVCGAGAVAGESAGMLWALAPQEARQTLSSLSKKYEYLQGVYAIAS